MAWCHSSGDVHMAHSRVDHTCPGGPASRRGDAADELVGCPLPHVHR